MRAPHDARVSTGSSAEMQGSFTAFIDLLYDLLERYATPVFLVLILLFLALILFRSHSKTIWFDEIFTAIVTMQPDWRHFIAAMPTEGNPPLNALLTRLFAHLFGLNAFSLRITPLLGFTGALIGLYVFVRRELGSIYALLAVMLTLAEPISRYSFEARPYGLLLGFLMLALTGWQAAAHATEVPTATSRAVALTAMAAGIAGCILSHNIGIVEVAVPLLLGEAVRTVQRRRFDWPLLAMGLIAFPAFALVVPMVRRTSRTVLVHALNITPPITLRKLATYSSTVKQSLYLILDLSFVKILLTVLLLAWILRVSRRALPRAHAPFQQVPRYIAAAALGALMLVPVTWLCMIPAGGWYFSRYGLGSVIGLSIIACLSLSMSKAGRTLVLILMLLAFAKFVKSYFPYASERPLNVASMALIASDDAGLPIVIADPMQYPSVWWYSPANVKNRVFYLEGTTRDVSDKGVKLVEAGIVSENPYMKAPVLDFDTFVRTHDHVLLHCEPYYASMMQRFLSAGFQVVPIAGIADAFDLHRVSAVSMP